MKEREASTGISEEEISAFVRQAQAGDAEAFAQVLGLIQAKLHRQAFFLSSDEHEALDLLQETVLEAWKHIARYDGRARFSTWVCSIMVHRHYDWLRRARHRVVSLFSAAPHDDVAEPARSPNEISGELDDARLMRECLDQLPAQQREIVYLRFYAGESLEGIAAIAKCSLGTVKSRLFYGLQRLAKMQKVKDLRNEREHEPLP